MRKVLLFAGLVAVTSVAPRAQAQDDGYDDGSYQQPSDDQGYDQSQMQGSDQGYDSSYDQSAPPEQQAQVNEQYFQEQLSPYGEWDSDSTYGRVFYPQVSEGWRPYVNGRWVWTAYGWMWVSDEPFGWATFHYGRWYWNSWRHRWGWVPGYEWAPAWVVWRFGGVHVGWAPLYVGYDSWRDDYPVVYEHWVYVPCEHFYGGPVRAYVYNPGYVRNVFYNTTVVNGYVGTVTYGPPTRYVAAHSAVPITTTSVVHAASPVQAYGSHAMGNGQVAVYVPPTTRVYNAANPAPAPLRGPGAAVHPVVAPRTAVQNTPVFRPSPHVSGPAVGNPGQRPGGQVYQPPSGVHPTNPGGQNPGPHPVTPGGGPVYAPPGHMNPGGGPHPVMPGGQNPGPRPGPVYSPPGHGNGNPGMAPPPRPAPHYGPPGQPHGSVNPHYRQEAMASPPSYAPPTFHAAPSAPHFESRPGPGSGGFSPRPSFGGGHPTYNAPHVGGGAPHVGRPHR